MPTSLDLRMPLVWFCSTDFAISSSQADLPSSDLLAQLDPMHHWLLLVAHPPFPVSLAGPKTLVHSTVLITHKGNVPIPIIRNIKGEFKLMRVCINNDCARSDVFARSCKIAAHTMASHMHYVVGPLILNSNFPIDVMEHFGNLKYVDLSDCKDLIRLPDLSRCPNLEVLDLMSCMSLAEIPSPLKHLSKLTTLNLMFCFPEVPCNIRRLDLSNTAVQQVPSSIRCLSHLSQLDLNRLMELQSLPDSICNLKSLREIGIYDCVNLQELPEDLGNLESLEELFLCGSAIKEIPDSICNLKNLVELSVETCANLLGLPANLGNLESLERLIADGTGIKELPESICNLKNLTELSVNECAYLQSLPENFGNLESLDKFGARSTGIKELPDSFGNLKELRIIYIGHCIVLHGLPESFGNLESLELVMAPGTGIKRLPSSINRLRNLRTLNFRRCEGCKMDVVITLCKSSKRKKLVSVEPRNMWDMVFTIRGLQLNRLVLKSRSLKWRLEDVQPDSELIKEIVKHISEKLNDGVPSDSYDKGLVGIDSRVKDAESLLCLESHLGNLKYVNLSFSKDLIRIPDLSGCPNLEVLDLYTCTSLVEIPPSIKCLSKLTSLCLTSCASLCDLPSLLHLKSLEVLFVQDCPKIIEFPVVPCDIRSLNMGRNAIEQVPSSIGGLSHLYLLDLGWSTGLESLPDSICNLKSLIEFRIGRCGNLKELPENLGNLESLERLLADGSAIKELPDSICNLKKLATLSVERCVNLLGLPANLGNLKSLENLYASGTGIKELPESICSLQNLAALFLGNCVNLQGLPENIGNLESLKVLQAYGTGIKELPDSFGNLKQLTVVDISDCVVSACTARELWEFRIFGAYYGIWLWYKKTTIFDRVSSSRGG
ncbi:hypothetical protein GH714_009005 [Hevea brasiliensis]|uniref:Disease resistance R13L4/SHOC-2-like LRR domain-containing protein n=1 Tax=Hevea brasiliensis TaxID=3981 RepID=A0A6A6L1Y9_HEVBR|nr:hypothetical protein GH714_009005 [Hevea brasiliensis]